MQSPQQYLALVTLLVRDYDEAIGFYRDVLGFHLIEDTALPAENKRWVVVAPSEDIHACRLLLAEASTPEQLAALGAQTGGRVSFFLRTDNIARDFVDYKAKGVVFKQDIIAHPYGKVAVFADLYGNLWDLIEPKLD